MSFIDAADARRGSERLRDAILAAMGIKPRKRTPASIEWTEEELDTLRRTTRAKLSTAVIATLIGRTECAVRTKAWKLGISLNYNKVQPQPRPADRSQWTDVDRIAAFACVPDELAGIVVQTAREHGFQTSQVRGESRSKDLVTCRKHICISAHELGYPYTTIGRALNRDHTTVMHAVKSSKSSLSTMGSTFVPCREQGMIAP